MFVGFVLHEDNIELKIGSTDGHYLLRRCFIAYPTPENIQRGIQRYQIFYGSFVLLISFSINGKLHSSHMDLHTCSEESLQSKKDEKKKIVLSKDEIVGGQWKVVQSIGSGTHGEIYKAFDINTNETVAVKVEHTNQNNSVCTIYHTRILNFFIL